VEFVPLPASGRAFSTERRVRLGDVSPAGRLRLDATARYLQDLANDDARDSGLPGFMNWVVRRTAIDVVHPCQFLEVLSLTTWASGAGSHWAERRYSIAGADGGAIEAATIWVYIDAVSGRPTRLPDEFTAVYGESMQGRTVSARLRHDKVPSSPSQSPEPWPLRFTDFDSLGHVNNAIAWSVVEELLSTRRELRAGRFAAEVEYGDGIEPGASVSVVTEEIHRGLHAWVVDGARTHLSVRVRSHLHD
jgi:acyl-ACP thioesterase